MLRGRRGKGRRRWSNDLTCVDLGFDIIIRKEATKTGDLVAHDLKTYASAMELISLFPTENGLAR